MKVFDMTEVGFVKRIVVGNTDPENLQSEEMLEKQIQRLNEYLSASPKGRIVGQEKNFYLLHIGEHQVVMQYIVYHVAFSRRPMGMR